MDIEWTLRFEEIKKELSFLPSDKKLGHICSFITIFMLSLNEIDQIIFKRQLMVICKMEGCFEDMEDFIEGLTEMMRKERGE